MPFKNRFIKEFSTPIKKNKKKIIKNYSDFKSERSNTQNNQ